MAKENLPGLGERLRKARDRKGLRQKDAAMRVGRSTPCIGMWESGETEPSYTDLMKLARYYEVSVEWLLGLETPMAVATQRMVEDIEQAEQSNMIPIFPSDEVAQHNMSAAKQEVQALSWYPTGKAFGWVVDTDALKTVCSNGDIAVIERDVKPAHDGVYLIKAIEGGAPTIRRCAQDQGNFFFMADAPMYPSFVDNKIQIIGRVREVVTRKLLK